MSVLLFSDPHLGVSRSTHTTDASRHRLQDAVYNTTRRIVQEMSETEPVVCLGDFFDASYNSEAVIAQAHEISLGIHTLLAGNHDLSNREGELTSFHLLDRMSVRNGNPFVVACTDEVGFWPVEDIDGSYTLVMVPHHATQEMFQQALQEATAWAIANRAVTVDRKYLLCLHCNYDLAFDNASDSTLTLSRKTAKDLLTVFERIFIGHEHNRREDFGGRLTLLGNVHPTSFADVSDKFVWWFDGNTLTPVKVWDKTTGYLAVSWDDLLAHDIGRHDAQFIEITGEAPVEQMPAIARAVAKLWASCHAALMIRNAVTPRGMQAPQQSDFQRLDLPSRIAAELADTPMGVYWAEYIEKVKTGG